MYDRAFARAANGEREAARTHLISLQTQWPGHPATTRAGALIGELGPRPVSRKSGVARGELVFWSTVGGVLVAVNICTIADCSTERETALVFSTSVGGSLALSLLASRNGVEQGEAQLYNSAQTWGSWNALAVNDGFATESDQAGVSLALQGGGLAAGIGLWRTWRPTQGDVALTNTFFFWSAVMAGWAHIAADANESGTLRRIVIAGDLGIVAGALVSRQVKMSRGRTLLIDVGGLLGTLGGLLVAIGSDSQTTVGASLMVGTGLGLAIATLVTKEWDAPIPPNLSLSPTRLTDPANPARGAWGVQGGFSF